jgi:hypothetical protein
MGWKINYGWNVCLLWLECDYNIIMQIVIYIL